ncbi:hypothetical protein SAY86_031313 [Trapa natans]|uniref:Signal recognition particle receptor subunit beta n=1 Tax=Trapa natans TaxID=22666 RepID=A0AAN7M7E9_TRANT|nr:hypothetical protein SAY86_031313 [Trapa natans]
MEGMEQWKVMIENGADQILQPLAQFIQYVRQIPPTELYAGIAVLAITVPFLLLFPLFKRKKSNTILLSGLSGSGKTVLFHQLRDGSFHQGHEEFPGCKIILPCWQQEKIKPFHLVDVPGHSRLLPKLEEYLPQAAGIIFVVDALEFLPKCRAASEYLYGILTNASVVKKKIPVLILCNKTDKVTAHTKDFIRKQMEKEIDKLRQSRNAISEADIVSEVTLGDPEVAFSFCVCQNRVTVAEASGLTGDVLQVEEFIREHVKP